ncbi:hypothetical protein [Pseudomonas sp. UBA1879]|uniref:hypothetical protein n=1 Tax=Pseudomonas sp. UBA1879 TaxID=1947305 RepID=UPI0025E1F04F|nr:hypothetical protein [Pseudomonas sp. UBA1879]
MKKSFLQRLTGAQPLPEILQTYQPARYGRCIYDRISEKRLREEDRERQRQQYLPQGNYDTGAVAIQNVWTWLPDGSLSGKACASDLSNLGWGRTHDLRLIIGQGVRRPLRQLETTSTARPSVDPTERAIELLHATVRNCALLSENQDWSRTEVHLPVPSGVDEMVWFESVVASWPEDQMPAWGFHVSHHAPGEWLRTWLTKPTTASNALCLSIDSRVNQLMNAQATANEVLGEAVSLIALCRLPPANAPAPHDHSAVVPKDIPGANPSAHVNRLSADVSPIAGEWVRLALTVLTARTENDPAYKTLHLFTTNSPPGWTIN